MKALTYTVLCLIVSSALLAQSPEKSPLPKEVDEYYQKYNIVKAFSSHEERSLLVRLMVEKDALPDLKDNRMRYIYQLIKDIQSQTSADNAMPNSIRQNDWKLQSSGLTQVQSWKYDEDLLVVRTVNYSLPLDVNTRLISQFDDYRKHNFSPLIDGVEDELSTQSTSLHTWRKVNGSWVKDDVEMVLVK